MKKIGIAVICVVMLAGIVGGAYFYSVPKAARKAVVASIPSAATGWKFPASAAKFPSTGSAAGGNLAYSSLPDPGGIPSGLPITLGIPTIGVDSAIEDALITPDGRMDVPAGTVDVAWFALGPQPGQVGSAVIGGHYGIQNGTPFVFYKLNELKVSDKVYVTNDKGVTYTFVVRSIASFGLNADATSVFTSTDGLKHLNLITCEGTWNEVNGNYPDRLVVFTDLVSESGGGVPTSVSAAPNAGASGSSVAFTRAIGLGDSGASVVALQTYLEQRGLLELPAGVSNGYFGALTRTALVRYQTSVGLSPVGSLGPLTRAKLNGELASATVLPNTGEQNTSTSTATGSSSPQSSVATQTLVTTIQGAFATPLYGLITSILLLGIAAMVFLLFRF